MKRRVIFPRTRFSVEMLRECIQQFLQVGQGRAHYLIMTLDKSNDHWKYDNIEDFYSEYREGCEQATLTVHLVENATDKPPSPKYMSHELSIVVMYNQTNVSINLPSRTQVNHAMSAFQDRQALARVPDPEIATQIELPSPQIFIGHGRSLLWRDLKDHLADQHNYKVHAYESGARAGHAIRDVLEEMLQQSSCAILVMTGEDETTDGELRARQNVVHEVGLFQGKIGFSRVIVLVEEGVEIFSNIQGVNQIRFSRGNIRETYGEVLGALRREFGDAR